MNDVQAPVAAQPAPSEAPGAAATNEAQAMVPARWAVLGMLATAAITGTAGVAQSYITSRSEAARSAENRRAEDERDAARQAVELGLKSYQHDLETKPRGEVPPPFVYVYE